jgi:hypothetical protein
LQSIIVSHPFEWISSVSDEFSPATEPGETSVIDFDALALGPIYDAFGEPAVLTLGAASYDLTVIDHTAGVEVQDGGIGLQTIRPAVDVRRSALQTLGIAVADLVGGELLLDGATWRVKSVIENGLELRLIVMQDQ